MASTPNGTNGFFETWEETPEENRLTIHYTECPTLKVKEEDLPFGKRYWIEGVPFPYPEDDFRQEFCNDFFVGSNEAIPRAALFGSLMDEAPPADLKNKSIGMDIGREHDLTALVGVGQTDDGHVWIYDAMTLQRTPFPVQQAEIRKWNEAHHPIAIVIDKTGIGTETAERMQSEFPYIVQPFAFSEQSKAELIGKAWSLFTAGKVHCPTKYRMIVDEISLIRKETSVAGKTLYRDTPHRDVGWACLLAIWGLKYERTAITTYSFDF